MNVVAILQLFYLFLLNYFQMDIRFIVILICGIQAVLPFKDVVDDEIQCEIIMAVASAILLLLILCGLAATSSHSDNPESDIDIEGGEVDGELVCSYLVPPESLKDLKIEKISGNKQGSIWYGLGLFWEQFPV